MPMRMERECSHPSVNRAIVIDEEGEGVKYARAAIRYEEARDPGGADAAALALEAADGDLPAVALAAVHALNGAEDQDDALNEAYFDDNEIEILE